MKKFLIAAFAMLTLSVGFTSCSDDEGGNSNYNIVSDPTSVVSGTYGGYYLRTLDNEFAQGTGSITIAAGKDKNTVEVTFGENSALGVPNVTVTCNIVQKGESRFIINAVGSKNDLGTTFRIYVDNLKDMTANFVLNVKEGRKNYSYDFEFVGSK